MRRALTSSLALIAIGLSSIGCAPKHEKSFLYHFNTASRIRYSREEEGGDFWQTAAQTKLLESGDCEDVSLSLLDSLRKDGYKVVARFGRANSRVRELHVWLEAEFGNETYIVDPTVGIVVKRSSLSPSAYQCIQSASLARTYKDYMDRNNIGPGINPQYDIYLEMLAKDKNLGRPKVRIPVYIPVMRPMPVRKSYSEEKLAGKKKIISPADDPED